MLVGLYRVFEQGLVSIRFTAKKKMNSLRYRWQQEDKLAYNNSLFLLYTFLERGHMEDNEVWQIQMQT